MAKPRKVEEPAGTYKSSPKRTVRPSTRAKPAPAAKAFSPEFINEHNARTIMDRLLVERKELLHKLAQ